MNTARLTVQQQSVGIQDNLVPARPQHTGDIPGSLELSEFEETLVGLDGVADQLGRSSFSLSSDDDGLLRNRRQGVRFHFPGKRILREKNAAHLLLNGLVYQKGSSLGDLLCDLLGCRRGRANACSISVLQLTAALVRSRRDRQTFYGMRKLRAERDVRDGNVIQDQVELSRSFHQVVPDQSRDHLSLGDQLAGVELRGDGFQDLVDDRGEYSLVIVGPELSVTTGSATLDQPSLSIEVGGEVL